MKGRKGRPFFQSSTGSIYTLVGGKPVIFRPDGNGYLTDSSSLAKIEKLKINSFYELPDQSILISTRKGLVHQQAWSLAADDQDFRVLIREVSNDQFRLLGGYASSQTFLNLGDLPYERNNLRFSYAATFYDEPHRTQYQYRLEGFDEDWSAWNHETFKEYTNLREGNYVFRVRAKNQYGKLSEEDSFAFRVSPPWYRSSLSYLGYTVLLALLVWGIVKLNTRKLLAQKTKLERLVEGRTREVKAQALELVHKNKDLTELSTFKQGLTDMIAHDMKNPLNVVIGLSEGAPDANKMKQVNQSGKLMLQLVTNMLDVQKFDEAEMKLNRAPHTLMDMLVQAKFQVELLAMARSIQLVFDVSKDIHLSCDREIIMRVLVNLFTNAIKYSEPGSKVRVKAEIIDQRVQIVVSDSGKGIHPEDLPYVFDKFWQSEAKKSGLVQSTGLGLTFCKIAVEAHGGMISVTSASGNGSTFLFDLELASAPKGSQQEQQTGLSLPEFDAIKATIEEIRQIPLYQFADIENALTHIDLKSETVEEWKEAVRHAALNWDEERFEKLLTDQTISKS